MRVNGRRAAVVCTPVPAMLRVGEARTSAPSSTVYRRDRPIHIRPANRRENDAASGREAHGSPTPGVPDSGLRPYPGRGLLESSGIIRRSFVSSACRSADIEAWTDAGRNAATTTAGQCVTAAAAAATWSSVRHQSTAVWRRSPSALTAAACSSAVSSSIIGTTQCRCRYCCCCCWWWW